MSGCMGFPTNDFIAGSSPLNLDLSKNKSLRTFEVMASSIAPREGSVLPRHAVAQANRAISNFLRTALSTITSPAFSEVVVIYREVDFGGLTLLPHSAPRIYRTMTPVQSAEEASWHRRLFKVFREMYAVRQDFQLVLCAEVWEPVGGYTMGVLKQAVAAEVGNKRSGCLPSELIGKPTRAWIDFGLSFVFSLARSILMALGFAIFGGFADEFPSPVVDSVADSPVPLVMYSPQGMPEEEPVP